MEERNETTFPTGRLKISRVVKSQKVGQTSTSPPAESCVVTFWEPEGDLKVRKAYGVAGLRRHKLL